MPDAQRPEAHRIDSALLASARAGDRKAQDRLLAELLPLLRAHAARRLDDRLRARLGVSDLVQMTLLEAAEGFPRFEGSSAAELRAWLLRILHSNHLDELKAHLAQKRGAGLGRSLDELLGSTVMRQVAAVETSPSGRVARRQELDAAHERLRALTPAQQQAFQLKVVEGLPVRAIAARMAISEDAVGGLLKRALKQLRKGEGDGQPG